MAKTSSVPSGFPSSTTRRGGHRPQSRSRSRPHRKSIADDANVVESVPDVTPVSPGAGPRVHPPSFRSRRDLTPPAAALCSCSRLAARVRPDWTPAPIQVYSYLQDASADARKTPGEARTASRAPRGAARTADRKRRHFSGANARTGKSRANWRRPSRCHEVRAADPGGKPPV